MNEVYLLDGSCFVYRAYHAIKGLSTSKGIPTNAVYGFTRMLIKLIRDKKVQYMLIAFDSPYPTKRHLTYEDYKITRPETPKDLPIQLDYIKEIIDAFGIKRLEVQGYEADDIIASLAISLKSSVRYIVTLDKDMLQLVSDNVKVYDPFNDLIIDRDYVIKKYGIPPERLTDFMALIGDTIDNIPGVKGIGEKSASELLRRYGSLDEILKNLEIIKPKRLAELLKNNIDYIKLSRELVELNTEVPVNLEVEDLKIKEPQYSRLIENFRRLEFNTLLRELSLSEKNEDKKDRVILNKIDSNKLIENIDKNSNISIICREDRLIIATNQGYFETDFKDKNLENVLNSNSLKILFNAKELFKKLLPLGIKIKQPYFDIMIAAYLLNPNKGKYELSDLAFEYLGKIYNRALTLEESLTTMFELYENLISELKEKELYDVFFKIEMPLVEVLAHMELAGIKVNLDKLEEIIKQVFTEIEKTTEKIYSLSGVNFNINSPKQLAEILYDKLGLKNIKKGKKARSTEMEVLEELSFQHELPGEVINYRILNKLLTGYLQPLKDYVNIHTKRIHTKWSQTTAGTGRIISSEPNLQNIPVKGNWAEMLREVFIPEEGFLFLSADYSQIELRILAHLSEDPSLIKAFKEDKDIHKATASEIFSLSEEQITEEHRRIAKTVNFGISYGISAFGLSESIKIPYEKAQELIDLYFLRYPMVKKFIENTIAFAKQKGYVRTLFGRIRPVPEVNSPNQLLRQQSERAAVNAVVQGTAADIIKIAMIRIYEKIKQNSINAKIILQIHDEVVVEVIREEIQELSEVIKKEMVDFDLRVPLLVNINIGENLNI